MIEQLDLLNPPTHVGDPITSHHAAAKIRPHAQAMRDKVLTLLKQHGPMTDDELLTHFDNGLRNSVGTRRGELVKQGLVAATGDYRRNGRGNLAQVWRAT